VAGWICLVAVVLFGAMCGPFFAGRVYLFDDLGAFHLPLRAYYAHALREESGFDWMGPLFAGMYLTGEGQAGTYHPWHYVLYKSLSLGPAFCWEILASYPVLFAGTWWLLRKHVRKQASALFGGLVFSFSAFNVLHFMHPNGVAVVAHLPWLLGAIHAAHSDTDRRRRAGALFGISLLTGSQLLLGYPQYVWISLIVELAYCGWLWRERPASGSPDAGERQRPGWRATAGHLAWAKVLGILIGSVQLLPTAEALAASSRQLAGPAQAMQGSLPPANVVQLIAPYLFRDRVVGENTHEYGMYVGMVPLFLIVGMARGAQSDQSRKRFFAAAAILGVGALVLAFGGYGLVYRVQTWLPLVGKFRGPCRYLVVVSFAAAAMAACGMDRLIERLEAGRQPDRTAGRGVFLLTGLAIAVAGVGSLWLPGEDFSPWPLRWVGPLLAVVSAVCVTGAVSGGRAWAPALVVLTAIDLGVYGLSYAVYEQTEDLAGFSAAVPVPNGPVTGRVAAEVEVDRSTIVRVGNGTVVRGIRRWDGYAGLFPSRSLDYHRLDLLRMAGVEWLLDGDAVRSIDGLDRAQGPWIQVPRPLPWARLVSLVETSADPSTALATIDVDTTAVVSEVIELDAGPAGVVEAAGGEGNDYWIRVRPTGRQLLVVAESFHPGWKAEVDGAPAAVHRVNADFMGCVVGPESREVRLSFRPAGVAVGRVLSAAGLGLAFLTYVFRRQRHRRIVE
jgi:hypothetical protein